MCLTCGKKFAARSNLIQHSRRHSFAKDTYESGDDQSNKISSLTNILQNKRKFDQDHDNISKLCFLSPQK